MSDFNRVPVGTGKHPIVVVTLSAHDVAASSAFYATVFGWAMHPISPALVAAGVPAGPQVLFRRSSAPQAQGAIPVILCNDVEGTLRRIVDRGATIDEPLAIMPNGLRHARFRDPSGTVYGLTDAASSSWPARIPMPFGDNPKPPQHTVCSVELYTAPGSDMQRIFGDILEWGMMETMPQYIGFDPGAGANGVFQSHTPALPGVAYVYVEDVDATLAAVRVAGGASVGEPMRAPGMGTFGYFTDPSGTTTGLIGP